MAKKGKKTKSTVAVNYTKGNPTRDHRGFLGYAHSDSDIKHVCALSDPFCDSARGAKIPDDDTTKSFAVQVKDIQGLNSDANGRGAISVRPFTSSTWLTSNVMTATQVTSWNAAFGIADATAINTAADSFRIVSWGIRVYSQLAPTNQSGQFRVITTPETPGAPFLYNTSFFEETKVYPVTEQSVHWISKPIGVGWKEYIALANEASWERVTIVADGLPVSTSSALVVELVFNLELQPNLGSITGAIANEAAPHKPHVLAAAGEVLSKHGGAMVRQISSNFFANAARAALNLVSTRFLGMPIAPPLRILN